MKIKISPKKCQYIINKNQRKVICIIHDTRDLLKDFVRDYDRDIILFLLNDSDKLDMPSSFRGVATCAEGDEWDEELGKRVAFARARYKLDKSFFKRANFCINEIDRHVDRLFEKMNNYGEVVEQNHLRRVKKLKNKFGDDFELYNKKEGEDN